MQRPANNNKGKQSQSIIILTLTILSVWSDGPRAFSLHSRRPFSFLRLGRFPKCGQSFSSLLERLPAFLLPLEMQCGDERERQRAMRWRDRPHAGGGPDQL